MDQERISIDLGNDKMAVLIVQPFDGDIDVESIVKIDYSNLLGEVLTFPVIFNRIANMRAEITNIVAVAKVKLEVFEAQLYEEHKKKLFAAGEKATENGTKAAVLRDARYMVANEKYLRTQRDFEYIDSLYWSAQSKDRKLNVLAEKITPQEFEKELVEGAVNGVMIKMSKKAMRDKR